MNQQRGNDMRTILLVIFFGGLMVLMYCVDTARRIVSMSRPARAVRPLRVPSRHRNASDYHVLCENSRLRFNRCCLENAAGRHNGWINDPAKLERSRNECIDSLGSIQRNG